MAASASACENGAMLSCRLSRSRAISVPTTSGRVAMNWPSLTYVGPSRVSAAASRPAPSLLLGRSISRASAIALLAGSGSGRVSMSASTPSRANTKPARERRRRWERAEITTCPMAPRPCRYASQLPARVQRDHAACHRREGGAAEAGRFHHARKRLRLGKFADRLDQILIGLAVAGDRFADARDHLKRIKLVERVEAGHVDRGKFQAKETSADLEHAESLAQRGIDAWHVADTEGDGHAIEAAVGIGKLFGIAPLEGDAIVEPALERAFGADAQHLGIDVADGDAGAGAARCGDAEGDVAGAAGK